MPYAAPLIAHDKRLPGTIRVEVPRNDQWASALRFMVPTSARTWHQNEKIWTIEDRYYRVVREITAHYFPSLRDLTLYEKIPSAPRGWQSKWNRWLSSDDAGPGQKDEGGGTAPASSGPYAVLCVTPDAPPEVIKASYKALSKIFHPDKGDNGDEERMAEINSAMDELKGAGIV